MTSAPPWWPPAVGARLRRLEIYDEGPRAILFHVVASFEHAGRHRVVVAFYGIHKQRWFYEVVDEYAAESMWVDGDERRSGIGS